MILVAASVFGPLAGCGSDTFAVHDAGASIHIWPETIAEGSEVGVYLEVAGLTTAKLDLQAFDGSLCGVGSTAIDAGMPTPDAGISSTPTCEQRTQFDVSKTPQTFVVVFRWDEGKSSGLLTATAVVGETEMLSMFRRISKGASPDAGIDAAEPDATPADAATGDAP